MKHINEHYVLVKLCKKVKEEGDMQHARAGMHQWTWDEEEQEHGQREVGDPPQGLPVPTVAGESRGSNMESDPYTTVRVGSMIMMDVRRLDIPIRNYDSGRSKGQAVIDPEDTCGNDGPRGRRTQAMSFLTGPTCRHR